MRRYLITAIFSLTAAAEAMACMPELPSHNSYMFSVFRRDALTSPFREDMNDWWKRYGGEPESTDESYYKYNRERLDSIARRNGDRQMLRYMSLLDAYLTAGPRRKEQYAPFVESVNIPYAYERLEKRMFLNIIRQFVLPGIGSRNNVLGIHFCGFIFLCEQKGKSCAIYIHVENDKRLLSCGVQLFG